MSTSVWRTRLSTIVWFVLVLGVVLSLPVVMDISGWLIIAFVVTSVVLAAPLVWVWRRLFCSGTGSLKIGAWLRTSVALWAALCIATALPFYYLATVTEVRPALAPQVTLSNGDKTVVFQGMMHVGSENFYKAVIYDVEKALADDYVLYYEGVQTNSPESEAFFAKLSQTLTGGQDLSAVYTALGQACGLKFQSEYFTLLEADQAEHPERHVIADVDALEMKQEYERLMQEDPAFAERYATVFDDHGTDTNNDDSIAEAVQWLENGSDGQRKLAGIICRGLMSISYSQEGQADQDTPLSELILEYRNQSLAQRIVAEPNPRIFITYGARHLPGVVALLKQADPAWSVESVKWLRAIEAPKRFDATLDLP